MGKIICPGCREELDKVVLGFGTRSWDERTQSYIHTEADEEGDWACPKCGATVSEVRFYPPEYIPPGRPFPKTYSDWLNLGMDIKEKDPDIGTIAQVNNGLISIAEDRPDAEEAKKWLVEKASELGIK